MMPTKKLKAACYLAAASTILFAAGCQSGPSSENDAAHSQNEVSEFQTLDHTQVAAGYRDSATLYPDHFDGPTLSSLGSAALDNMLADSHSCNPLVVYMDIPDDSYSQDRRLAVGRYLEDKGLKAEQIEFQSGNNPGTEHAVDMQLADLPKADTAGDFSSGGGGGGSSSSSSSSSSTSGH